MAAETNETGFLIDGKVYEIPALWDFTMAERRLLFELTGFSQEDFLLGADETEDEQQVRVEGLLRHPGYVETLMLVAYQRGNPTMKATKVKLVIDQTNYMDAIQGMVSPEEDEEDDPSPLASTSEPDRSSENGPLDKPSSTQPLSATGGNGSGSGSAAPDASQRPITISRLDISSESHHGISVP